MNSTGTLGRAGEIKVQIFGGRSNERVLQDEISAWLADNAGVEVQEIQYRYDVYNSVGWYSAMVIYR